MPRFDEIPPEIAEAAAEVSDWIVRERRPGLVLDGICDRRYYHQWLAVKSDLDKLLAAVGELKRHLENANPASAGGREAGLRAGNSFDGIPAEI